MHQLNWYFKIKKQNFFIKENKKIAKLRKNSNLICKFFLQNRVKMWRKYKEKNDFSIDWKGMDSRVQSRKSN